MAFAILAALLAWASITPPVAAQSEPPPISQLTNISSPLNDQQRRDVARYASFWAAELCSPEADRSRLAKRRLQDPLRAPAVSPVFRDEYDRALRPELEKLVQSDSAFCAMNAVQMAAMIGTDSALTFLRDRIDPNREPRMAVRLAAVNGVRYLAMPETRHAATPRAFEQCVREIGRAGERETDWLILLRQFEALAEVRSPEARRTQISLLKVTLDRIEAQGAEGGPSEMMQAAHQAILLWRDQWTDPRLIPSAERSTLGRELAPQLVRIFGIAALHWDAARTSDDRVRIAYDGAIRLTEQVLKLVDGDVRGQGRSPGSSADSAWGNGNRERFETHMNQWREVISNPPYASR